MYGKDLISTPDLQIPHIRLHERAFVLRPLCDMNPNLMHPTMNRTVSDLLSSLPEGDVSSMRRVTPLGKCSKGLTRLVDFGLRTYVCGVLNVTPDSFTDGGQFVEVKAALTRVIGMLDEGADMIDIGGESTRPGSSIIDVQDEIDRVVPIIKAIRAAGLICPISVDTRSSVVAKEAVLAGANIINDVSGGRYDTNMLSTASHLNVPIIMMHMRGTPQTMTSKEHTTYSTGDCIAEIAVELNEQLSIADSLMPRWMQLTDPGIGFAKVEKENLTILKGENMQRLKSLLGDRPMFFGSSRKRFLGAIIDRADAVSEFSNTSSSSNDVVVADGKIEAVKTSAVAGVGKSTKRIEELDWATAATTAAAVAAGVEIIRVHNVRLTRIISDITKAIRD